MLMANSPLMAGLDDSFSGEILVVGGQGRGQKDRVTLNMSDNCDIRCYGWDVTTLSQLKAEKYQTVIFDHVGMVFFEEFDIEDVKINYAPPSLGVALIYYQLLKPGGSIELFSGPKFLHDQSHPATHVFDDFCNLGLVFNYDASRHVLLWDESNRQHIAKRSYEGSGQDIQRAQAVWRGFAADAFIMRSLSTLSSGGFINLSLRPEVTQCVAKPQSPPTLHISGIKPSFEAYDDSICPTPPASPIRRKQD